MVGSGYVNSALFWFTGPCATGGAFNSWRSNTLIKLFMGVILAWVVLLRTLKPCNQKSFVKFSQNSPHDPNPNEWKKKIGCVCTSVISERHLT